MWSLIHKALSAYACSLLSAQYNVHLSCWNSVDAALGITCSDVATIGPSHYHCMPSRCKHSRGLNSVCTIDSAQRGTIASKHSKAKQEHMSEEVKLTSKLYNHTTSFWWSSVSSPMIIWLWPRIMDRLSGAAMELMSHLLSLSVLVTLLPQIKEYIWVATKSASTSSWYTQPQRFHGSLQRKVRFHQ